MSKNPFLFPLAMRDGETIKWHSFAERENSSQALCLSAFGSLRADAFKQQRDRLVARLVGQAFPTMQTKNKARRWMVEVEVEDPTLLNEHGPAQMQTTSIDVLLTSSQEVVAIEAKFDRDAAEGFGSCSQFSKVRSGESSCRGYFGPGSDRKGNSPAWCRLENWDGIRSPRNYWSSGRRYFQPSVFAQQQVGEVCPLRGSAYQLMRNFLFAAAYAEKLGREQFGLLIVCSERKDQRLKEQVTEFKQKLLLPRYADHVRLCHYEEWIMILEEASSPESTELATFLRHRIERILPAKS